MTMKNIQIIDGADNCEYSIYSVTEDEFRFLFPGDGQDVEFIEDVAARSGEEKIEQILTKVWNRRVEKKDVSGIHGTLFYQLLWKKKYYPTKREREMAFVLSSRD